MSINEGVAVLLVGIAIIALPIFAIATAINLAEMIPSIIKIIAVVVGCVVLFVVGLVGIGVIWVISIAVCVVVGIVYLVICVINKFRKDKK